ncbi:MAG: hypothetical protein KAV87_32520 [Desulfobacteraceae bacterium]|nr:hypothetical protein [Desulfobacteraceae bacterium]
MEEGDLFTLEEYLRVLDLSYEVAQSLKGRPSEDPRLPDCQQLALKLFMHCASCYWLSLGTKAPVAKSVGGANFFDFASIAVITRASLETYLTLFEVFIAPTNDDEFEFRHALWQLSGFIVREGLAPTDPSLEEAAIEAGEDIEHLRDRIRSTHAYKALTKKQKRNVLNGRRTRNWKEVALSAGFGPQFIKRVYSYYCSYVHADGLSGVQIMGAKTAEEQKFHIKMHMFTLLLVMSKMILNYADKFEEAEKVLHNHPELRKRMIIWTEAVRQLA